MLLGWFSNKLLLEIPDTGACNRTAAADIVRTSQCRWQRWNGGLLLRLGGEPGEGADLRDRPRDAGCLRQWAKSDVWYPSCESAWDGEREWEMQMQSRCVGR